MIAFARFLIGFRKPSFQCGTSNPTLGPPVLTTLSYPSKCSGIFRSNLHCPALFLRDLDVGSEHSLTLWRTIAPFSTDQKVPRVRQNERTAIWHKRWTTVRRTAQTRALSSHGAEKTTPKEQNPTGTQRNRGAWKANADTSYLQKDFAHSNGKCSKLKTQRCYRLAACSLHGAITPHIPHHSSGATKPHGE